MEKHLTQWHPAFCSAIKLELIDNKKDLDYHSEFGLNTKPILIDLLVIKKASDISINNEIGKIFKGHNIFEYKSPYDTLNIDTFFKVIAYASLYKASGTSVDSIRADDVTISFVRDKVPKKLFQQLKLAGMGIEEVSAGIYYVHCNFFFDIQIIVTKDLKANEHIWLSSLTDNLTKENAEKLVIEAATLSNKDEKEFAESVLQVALSKNAVVFQQVKEVAEVCEALAELMKPEMDAAIENAIRDTERKKDKEIAEKEAEIRRLKEQLAKAQVGK